MLDARTGMLVAVVVFLLDPTLEILVVVGVGVQLRWYPLGHGG